jgi:RNA polymerase sigma-70 factor (ECF subfamily)
MQLDPDRAAALLDRLYRTAILITRDPHEAEDLVQDTYELILRRPRQLRGDSELHYMRAAMRRRAVDRHRESRRRVPVVGLESAPDVRSRAGEEPGRRAEQAEVIAAIRALPHIHRDVLVATYVAGLTYSEAAAALGVKRGTVMSRVFRAREALVNALDRAGIAATAH